jgi:hypothetical protein
MIGGFTVEITSEAYAELAEIMEWYSIQRKGLEKEFSLSFEAAINRLARNPFNYQIFYKNARSVLLQRFPYKVVFKIYDSTIKVYSIFHHSRNPTALFKKLK